LQVLGREPDEGGLQFWSGLLLRGQPVSVIAEGIFESDERLDPTIGQYYQQYLLRPVEPAGLAFWRDSVWKRDGGPENVVAGMISSSEFFASAGRANPLLTANEAWVTELYRRLLNRAPEASGLAFWRDALDAGRLSRQQVVLGFVQSDENYKNLIIGWFQQYLARNPQAAELGTHLANMKAGASHRRTQIALIDSFDYRNTPPPPAAGTVARLP